MTVDDHDVDLEAALDRLVETGAVDETEDGELSTTTDFEDARSVYHDAYAGLDEDAVREAVADLLGLHPAEAESRVEGGEETRQALVAFLALQSFLDDLPDTVTLAAMADLVVQIDPCSPVPGALPDLDDDSYGEFLDDHPDAVITVWKRHCDPCEALKEDLDGVLTAFPDGVAVAGVDGETVSAFRRKYDVDAAPTLLFFRDGAPRERLTGRRSPDEIRATADAVYSDD